MSNVKKKMKEIVTARGTSSAALTAAVIAVVIAFNAVIYALTSLFGLYIYTPHSEDLSLSGATDALFEEAIKDGKQVTITFCMSEKDLKEHSTGSFVYKTAKALSEKYEDFIKLRFVNIYTHIDDESKKFVSLEKYKTDLRGNETPLRANSVIFSSGEDSGEIKKENYRVITDVSSGAGFSDFYVLDGNGDAYAYIGEEIISSMVCWVLQTTHKTAYLTQNHGETIDRAFNVALSCAGYYVSTVNLRTSNRVPEDADLVIISNPTSDFERGANASVYAEIEKLETYMSQENGSVYVSLDPNARRLTNLEGFLADWGITVDGSEREDVYYKHIVKDNDLATTLDGITFSAAFSEGEKANAVIGVLKESGLGVKLREAASLVLDQSCGAVSLLTSSATAVTMAGDEVASEEGGFTVAAYSEKKNKQGGLSRVFVIPSTYMTSTEALTGDGFCNKDFVYSVLTEVFDASYAPIGCRRVVYDIKALEGLTFGTADIYAAIILSIPVALCALGVVTVVRRKHR